MGAKNFVNQFKNTRRQIRVETEKSLKNAGAGKKIRPGRRLVKKYSGARDK